MPLLRDRKIARSVGEGAERGKRPKGEGEVQRGGGALLTIRDHAAF